MDETCLWCGAHAYVAWANADDTLDAYLCAHHSRELAPRMEAAGWQMWLDDRASLEPVPVLAEP